MEYRRLMEGAIRANVQPTDISQLVTQQLFTYYDAFQKAQIDLQVELAEGLELETPRNSRAHCPKYDKQCLKHGRKAASISLKKTTSIVSLPSKYRPAAYPISR